MCSVCLRDLNKADILEKALIDQIRKGILKEGSRLLPEREISRKYKTSRGVVRKVLGKLVDQGVFERRTKAGTILKAFPPQMDYSPGLKHILYVFLPSTGGMELHNFSYIETVYCGVEKEALKFNCDVSILLGEVARKRVKRLGKGREDETVDGALVSGSGIEPVIDDLKKAKIPFVIVDSRGGESDLNYVCPDNFQGGYLAAKHLMGLGHLRIGFLYPVYPGENFIQSGYLERLAGFQAAFREKGNECDASLIIPLMLKKNFDLDDEAYVELERFLVAEQKVTVVFLADDSLAACVYRVAAKNGIVIPGQLSVLGFGDTAICEWLVPAVSSVRVDRFMMGQKSFLMLKSLADNPDQPAGSQTLAVKLIQRGSTAAPIG